ncbi:actin-like protein Arp6 [Schizosaccharomyces japonicus yFS275]|uniref:Actin-like protein ARP6 n=1 Tax=Schizosaccharomyces japonicus (strain yFS275 / FY16936) TaxID=402676 RepID=B6K4X9_SCHJY|nr:actin-like protein Arp6 [Schizosaccharomyces japonicus yFS275]EEB08536.2 actin-like protein Arp6 [Schizosaccharomyces japonicus yFS275]
MTLPSNTLILDNGAYTIKAGFPNDECLSIPNCLCRSKDGNRLFLGDEISVCKDFSSLQFKRAHEKGYVTNWSTEISLWDQTFQRLGIQDQKMNGHSLVLTEAPFTMPSIQMNTTQVVFEEFEFDSLFTGLPAEFVAWNDLRSAFKEPKEWGAYKDCVLVIDSGYSFTHIIPVMNGIAMEQGIRRIDLGGRFLTNYLKEIISYRKFNMMKDFYLVNEIKEATCFVSQNLKKDMEMGRRLRRNPLQMFYALPDYSSGRMGGVISSTSAADAREQQILGLCTERFVTPELLFSPSDIGMHQSGIPETVMQSLEQFPEDLAALFLANIVLVGGNVKLPGFRTRFEAELRALAPSTAQVRSYLPKDAITFAWQGAGSMPMEFFQLGSVSRHEFAEHGMNVFRRKKMSLRLDAHK